jgi:hypothetical protein
VSQLQRSIGDSERLRARFDHHPTRGALPQIRAQTLRFAAPFFDDLPSLLRAQTWLLRPPRSMAICCMAGLLRLRLERVYVRLNVEGRYPVTSLTIEASHFI